MYMYTHIFTFQRTIQKKRESLIKMSWHTSERWFSRSHGRTWSSIKNYLAQLMASCVSSGMCALQTRLIQSRTTWISTEACEKIFSLHIFAQPKRLECDVWSRNRPMWLSILQAQTSVRVTSLRIHHTDNLIVNIDSNVECWAKYLSRSSTKLSTVFASHNFAGIFARVWQNCDRLLG